MKLLILHRIPYFKIDYHLGIDHHQHEVTYLGKAENLATIPEHLPCKKVLLCGNGFAVEAEEHIRSILPIDHIIALSEYDLIAAATLRETFSIPGAGLIDVNKVRHKIVMKNTLCSSGIAVPEFLSLSGLMKTQRFSHPGKVVVKPVDGASSENIFTGKDYREVMHKISTGTTGIHDIDHHLRPLHEYEIEAFIKGPVIHIDGLVAKGKVILCLASKYIGTCLNYVKGMPLGSVQIETTSALREWTQRCISAVNVQQGSFHLEAIETNAGLIFLEIANRVGGADVVKTFELATGVHLPSAELKLLLGEDERIFNIKQQSNYKYGWFVFPGHHLNAARSQVLNAEVFYHHKNILGWYTLAQDKTLSKQITYQRYAIPLAGIVRSHDVKTLVHFMLDMFNTIKIIEAPDILKVA